LLRANSKAAKNSLVNDRGIILKTPEVELDIDRIYPARVEEGLRKRRTTQQHVDGLPQEVGTSPRARMSQCPTISELGPRLRQARKTSRLDQYFVVVIDDPAATTDQDCGWMLDQEINLNGQTIR
jgi:hypothetical protein